MTSEPSVVDQRRLCAWCRQPIPAGKRVDAETCSTPCRQARHRFTRGVGAPTPGVDGGHALRLAYADPPYPGLSRKYYADHPDYAGEVDHAALIASLAADYDGWALSTSAAALPMVLASCPPGVRVAAWHRGERPTRSYRPLNAWEPVIYAGGRLHVGPGSTDTSPVDGLHVAKVLGDASSPDPRRVDSLVYRPGVRRTDPNRVIGAKPAIFCRWIFDLLGALPGDELIDIYPGSGGVSRAWDAYCAAAARHDACEVTHAAG